jgi:hypothetical protein
LTVRLKLRIRKLSKVSFDKSFDKSRNDYSHSLLISHGDVERSYFHVLNCMPILQNPFLSHIYSCTSISQCVCSSRWFIHWYNSLEIFCKIIIVLILITHMELLQCQCLNLNWLHSKQKRVSIRFAKSMSPITLQPSEFYVNYQNPSKSLSGKWMMMSTNCPFLVALQ